MIKILFQGWINVPHSYAIVLSFILVHLHLHFHDQIQIFVDEQPLFNPLWKKLLVYPPHYNLILQNLTHWTPNIHVDLIFRITYPYNIENSNTLIPKCIFYTSEFKNLTPNYFSGFNNDLQSYLLNNHNLFFTAPSLWSLHGLHFLPPHRNKLITHGVDTSIYHFDPSMRHTIRQKYNFNDDDVVLLSIGSMTGNKNIQNILYTLHYLLNVYHKYKYKLLLKGTKDLYNSYQMINSYINLMDISSTHKNTLLSHICFIDKTFDCTTLNHLYNAADLYVSPYIAEGFNLTTLEALASGLPILVPSTGSTKEYINDIYQHGGHNFIYYVPSTVIQQDWMSLNKIHTNDIINSILHHDFKLSRTLDNFLPMQSYISKHYSWLSVCNQLVSYFKDITQK